MRPALPICLVLGCALLSSRLAAFDYSVDCPGSVREGGSSSCTVSVQLEQEEKIVLVEMAAPGGQDRVAFLPGGISFVVSDNGSSVWNFTFNMKGIKRGTAQLDPFTVKFFKDIESMTAAGTGEESETMPEPEEQKLDCPPVIVKPPHFWKRKHMGWILGDTAAVLILFGIYWFIRNKRKGRK